MPLAFEPDLYRNILEQLPAGLCVVDRNRRILVWSRGAEELTGYLSQEAIGRECGAGLLMHCDLEGAPLCGERCPFGAAIRDGRPVQNDAFLLRRDGARIPVHVKTSPVHGEDGHVVGASALFAGCAPRVSEPLLERPVDLDLETQLPGRGDLSRMLAAALRRIERGDEGFGILLFAIDGLDELLHADGRNGIGAVFHTVGQTLAENLPPEETLGRWSQERLLGIVRACAPATLRSRAAYLQKAARLASAPWWGERISVTVSVAGALALPGESASALVGRAEDALTAHAEPGRLVIAHAPIR